MTTRNIGPTKADLRKRTSKQRLKRIISIEPVTIFLSTAGFLAIAILVIAVSFYVSHFDGRISSDSSKWADFGAYLGGLVTPVLSCLTFLGLLLTIYFQRIELKASSRSLEIVREELQLTKQASQDANQFNKYEILRGDLKRVLEITTEAIEQRFTEIADFSPSKEAYGYYFSFSAPSDGLKDIPNNTAATSHDRTILLDLVELHSNLIVFINDYEARFGSTAIVYQYKYYYKVLDFRLREKGFVLNHPFNPFERQNYVARAPVPDDMK